MRAALLVGIDRVVGDRLSQGKREELADALVKIVEEYNRRSALSAVESVKQTIVRATDDAAAEVVAEAERNNNKRGR